MASEARTALPGPSITSTAVPTNSAATIGAWLVTTPRVSAIPAPTVGSVVGGAASASGRLPSRQEAPWRGLYRRADGRPEDAALACLLWARTERFIVTRFTPAGAKRRPDELIVEEPMTIQLDGTVVSTTMRTPGNDYELAAGFCLTEGLLGGATVTGVRYCANGSALASAFNDVTVETGGAAPAPVPRLGATTSSCGWCGRDELEVLLQRLDPLPATDPIEPAVLAAVPERVLGRPGPVHDHRCGPCRGGLRRRRGHPADAGGRRASQRRRQGRRRPAARRPTSGDRSGPVRQRPGLGGDGPEGVGRRLRRPRRRQRADRPRRARRPACRTDARRLRPRRRLQRVRLLAAGCLRPHEERS